VSIKHFGSQVACDILAYLAENPGAGDTIEGILEWWLIEVKIKQETEKVQKALDVLEAKGFVIKSRLKNSRVFYKVNPAMIEKIQDLIHKTG
jgi:DNA-binding MarR family transcriptional regulator